MKFRWISAVLIVAIGLMAGGSTYFCMHKPMPVADAGGDVSLLWLRTDFDLSPDKMERITRMHAAFKGVCDEHCQQIQEARTKVKKLREQQAEHCDIVAAEARVAALDLKCVTSLKAHLHEIADVMGGAEGRRYLATVLPRVERFDHQGAPNLNLDTKTQAHDHHAHH